MADITLQEKTIHIVKAGEPGYLVRSGEVLVALQPYRGTRPLRRLYLGTARIGDYIPAPLSPTLTCGKDTLTVVYLLSSGDNARLSEVRPQGEWTDAYRSYLDGSYFALDETVFYDGLPGEGSADEDSAAGADEKAPDSLSYAAFHTGERFWRQVTALYAARKEKKTASVRLRGEERIRAQKKIHLGQVLPFASGFRYRIMRLESQDHGIYDAAAFLCACRNIRCVEHAYLKKACGIDYTIADIARLSGFGAREVHFKNDRVKKNTASGVLCFMDAGGEKKPVVVFSRFGLNWLYDPESGEVRRLSPVDQNNLGETAYVFDRPFEKGKVGLKDILAFCAKDIQIGDVAVLGIAVALLAQIGIAFSVLNQMIYGDIIPGGDEALAYGLGIIFLSALVANFLITVAKNLSDYRIGTRFKNAVQLAVFERVFHLPENYFRKRESASEAYRITLLSDNYATVIKTGWNAVVEFIFCLFYLRRMFACSKELSVIGLAVAAAMVVVTGVFGVLLRRTSRVRIAQTAQIRSFLYQIFMGIGTIRTAGAEDAFLWQYMEKEAILQRNQRRSDRLQVINTLLLSGLNAVFMIAMYRMMGTRIGINAALGEFMGFVSANALFSASITQMTNSLSMILAMKPMLKEAGEFLKVPPEGGDEGIARSELRGDITLSHITFAYEGTKKPVVNALSLTIKKGEYIGIAGYSGCGKSTLLRLLLGFEKPAEGQIYYDGIPMNRLSLPELRRKIGAVMQDGSLISGSILDNITIAKPDATEEEVQQALAAAGLKDEVDAMPMGLLTHVSEEAVTISGGQKQRILIARAILGNPRLLLFDEATSSLDNISQEKISDALSLLSATRIVVAHRLSTLKLCDRILVMDRGRITEEGSYEELMERKGRFYEMVKIQQAV